MTTIIYILSLLGGKFYVGKTKNLEQRFKSHKSGNGAEWTKLYRPIGIIHSYEVPDHLSSIEETKMTFRLMTQKGINNVRGAEYADKYLYDRYMVTRIRFSIKHHLNITKTNTLCGCGSRKNILEYKCPSCLYIDSNHQLKLQLYIDDYENTSQRNASFGRLVSYIILHNRGVILHPGIEQFLLRRIEYLQCILKTLILLVLLLARFRYKVTANG